jgi:hypothetical protein
MMKEEEDHKKAMLEEEIPQCLCHCTYSDGTERDLDLTHLAKTRRNQKQVEGA